MAKQIEFDKWSAGMAVCTQWINGIEYKFCTMADGWVAVFQVESGEYTPMIQAIDFAHAHSWCSMREPITVPCNFI